MDDTLVIWDLEDDEDGNVQHCLKNNVTQDEVMQVLLNRRNQVTTSRSSGRRLTFGFTDDGRYLAVVWEHEGDDPLTMCPVTAYDVNEPTRLPKKPRKR